MTRRSDAPIPTEIRSANNPPRRAKSSNRDFGKNPSEIAVGVGCFDYVGDMRRYVVHNTRQSSEFQCHFQSIAALPC